MQTNDLAHFRFSIPPAQMAVRPRPHAQHRLLAFRPKQGEIRHLAFVNLKQALPPHSLLVINNSLVLNACLRKDPDDGRVVQVLNPKSVSLTQVVLAAPLEPGQTLSLRGAAFAAREAGKGIAIGELTPIDPGLTSLPAFLERYGVLPVPSYVNSERLTDDLPADAFSVCYASVPGSLSCPTAGLHFTPALMADLRQAGHEFVEITHHIGYGSWGDVKTPNLSDFDLDAEEMNISLPALQKLWQAKRSHQPVIAVGTTCVRSLESIPDEVLANELPQAGIHRTTNLFIFPPFQPRVVDGLLTDFAYPQTPVMIMSAALAGEQAIMQVYQLALQAGYQFDIFGDGLLICLV